MRHKQTAYYYSGKAGFLFVWVAGLAGADPVWWRSEQFRFCTSCYVFCILGKSQTKRLAFPKTQNPLSRQSRKKADLLCLGGGIRTHGLLHPMQTRYRTALHPEKPPLLFKRGRISWYACWRGELRPRRGKYKGRIQNSKFTAA